MKQGDTLGSYRILKEIGRGGQAAVFLAEDPRLGRRVALKVLPPGLHPDEERTRRFEREAAIAARLDHPNICTVHETGSTDGRAWIAMGYVEGETLAQHIDLATPPAIDSMLVMAEKTARALHVAHEAGLVHRDVKPGNIMLTPSGDPVVLDFGVASVEDENERLTLTGVPVGTPAYLPPEQLRGRDAPDPDRRADVYSLGATLFEALTLHLPFDQPTRIALFNSILKDEVPDPRRYRSDLPKDLAVVLEMALEKEPDRRYRTALEFAEDLRRVRESHPVHARPVGTAGRTLRWARRNPALAGAMGSLFVVLAAGLAVTSSLLKTTSDALDVAEHETEERKKAQGRAEQSAERTRVALGETEKALGRAQVAALLGASVRAEESDPVLALLLAREAFAVERSFRTEQRLREAILHSRERLRLGQGRFHPRVAAFTADGSALLLGLQSGHASLRSVEGKLLAEFVEQGLAAVAVAITRDAETMIVASENGDVWIYEPDGSPRLPIRQEGSRPVDIDLAPDERSVLIAWDNRPPSLWMLDGTRLMELAGHAEGALSARFSRDGRSVLARAKNGSFRLWNADGTLRALPKTDDAPLVSARWSADGESVVTASADGAVRLFDRSGQMKVIFEADRGPLVDARYGSGRVVALSRDGRVTLWDSDGRHVRSLEAGGRVESLLLDAGRRRLVTFLKNRALVFWDLEGRELGRSAGTISGGIRARLRRMILDSGGTLLATVPDSGPVQLTTMEASEARVLMSDGEPFDSCEVGDTGALVLLRESGDRRVALHRADGSMVRWLEDSRDWSLASRSPRLLSVHRETGEVRVGDVAGATGSPLPTMDPPAVFNQLSPDGERVVRWQSNQRVSIWDVRGGGLLAELSSGTAGRPKVRHSRTGDFLMVWQGTIATLHDRDGRELCRYEAHGGPLKSADVSDDGTRVLTASSDKFVRLYDAEGNELMRVHPGRDDPIEVELSRDLTRFVMADGSRVYLWATDGRLVGSWYRGFLSHPRVRWSAEGDRFVVESRGQSPHMEVRDRDGHLQARMEDPDGRIRRVEFARGSTRLISLSSRGLLRTWILDRDELAALAESRSTREMTLGERERFGLLAEEHAIEIVARSRIAELRQEHWVVEDVIAALESDPDLDLRVRDAALAVARSMTVNYDRLNENAWIVVRTPAAKPEDVQKALRAIEWLCGKLPGNGALLNTFGGALLQSGQFEEALSVLKESNRLNRDRRKGGEVSDSAFLAITHHNLGNKREAVEALKELERQMGEERNRKHWENRALQEEVRRLLGPKSD